MTKRDTVLTVAIGRNGPDGVPMDSMLWDMFIAATELAIKGSTATIVFDGHSNNAIGSDGANEGESEDSYAFIAINPTAIPLLRMELATLCNIYQQGSMCFAIDGEHEPVFNTPSGDRPKPVTAATYAPTHGGYPR